MILSELPFPFPFALVISPFLSHNIVIFRRASVSQAKKGKGERLFFGTCGLERERERGEEIALFLSVWLSRWT